MNLDPFEKRASAYQGAAVAGVSNPTDSEEDPGIVARLSGFGGELAAEPKHESYGMN